MERFRGRRFAPLNPPLLLDHEGADILAELHLAQARTE
jgi:hypothetical protein